MDRKYDEAFRSLEALLAGESDPVTVMANAAAQIYATVEGINWAGFYRAKNGELLLGPFQGKPACMHISFDRGVCGAAYTENSIMVVDDVETFPGHIACDAASRSEVVVPVRRPDGTPAGLLDVDSPEKGRFTDGAVEYFRRVAALIEELIKREKIIEL